MNKLDLDYQALLQDILDNGVKKEDRTGTGTISVFGRTIRHKMSDGFPLLTTKKMAWKGIVSELIWFLQGRTDLRYLLEHNNHIWVGDAYKKYENGLRFARKMQSGMSNVDGPEWEPISKEEFIEKIKTDDEFNKKWGDLGPIYGKQWRNWNGDKEWKGVQPIPGFYITPGYDQIANLINDLKNNPDSRRLMVNAWNVAEIDQMTLPPCHYGFQCYTRELTFEERLNLITIETDTKSIISYCENPSDEFLKGQITAMLEHYNIPTRAISLSWNQRSVDTLLGLPFNIASYGLLLEILAKICNMVPDELIGNLGDTHLYSNHLDQAREQIGRSSFELPKLVHGKTETFWKSFDVTLFGHLDPIDFTLENYQSHPSIKASLSN